MPLTFQSAADSSFEPVSIPWLWRSYLAAGKLTLLDGDPGCGKSLLTIDLTARLSRGAETPDNQAGTETTRSLILNAEDDAADTILPRLRAAQADLQNVFIPSGRDMPQLPDDLPQLESMIIEQRIRLVAIDSLTTFLPKLAGGHVIAVRQFLAPLVALAAKTGAAILLIRHLNKNTDYKTLYRGLGSIGITGLARTVLLAQTSPNDPARHHLRIIKSNLAAVPAPLSYRLVDRDGIPIVNWSDSTDAPDEVESPPPQNFETPGIVRATLWLIEALAAGPKPAVELLLAAKAHGIRERTLEIAKRQLKIKSKVRRDANGKRCWLWRLPEKPDVSQLPPLEIELEPLNDPNEDPYPEELSDKARELIDRDRLAWAKRVLDGK